MNAQAMRPNEWPQNERTKAANERTDNIAKTQKFEISYHNIVYERTNKPNNRTSEMTAKQTENGPMAQANACKPGDPTNG